MPWRTDWGARVAPALRAYAPLTPATAACHDMLWRATEAGFAEANRQGATSSTVFRAMARECGIADDAADRSVGAPSLDANLDGAVGGGTALCG